MSPTDRRVYEIWAEHRGDAVARALAFRREARVALQMRWSAEARIGHPDCPDAETHATDYEAERRHWLALAIKELRMLKERRRHAA